MSKYVGTGPLSYKKIIYRGAVSQRLRNTGLKDHQKRRKRRIDADGGYFEGYYLHQSVSTPSVLEHSGDTLYYDRALANFLSLSSMEMTSTSM